MRALTSFTRDTRSRGSAESIPGSLRQHSRAPLPARPAGRGRLDSSGDASLVILTFLPRDARSQGAEWSRKKCPKMAQNCSKTAENCQKTLKIGQFSRISNDWNFWRENFQWLELFRKKLPMIGGTDKSPKTVSQRSTLPADNIQNTGNLCHWRAELCDAVVRE